MKNSDEYLNKAIQNIVEDRAATKSLLMNLMKYMQSSDDRHREVGLVAAKYVETLQRSNDQLVRLVGLMKKKSKDESSITEVEKEKLFDMINEPSTNEGEE